LKTKKIYIIRHGETDYNKMGVVQGSGIDAPLNEEGRRQAQAFYNSYKNIKFDKIYISALQRTKQSVMNFIDCGLPYEELAGLNEIHWGVKEGVPFSSSFNDSTYVDVITAWRNGKVDLALEGGESPLDVKKRLADSMDYIVNKQDEQQILICMHGRALRILLCHLLNYDLSLMDNFSHSNLCLYKLSFTGSFFTIDLFNEQSHLKLN
jgi:broad specificity phosphatase PhoE